MKEVTNATEPALTNKRILKYAVLYLLLTAIVLYPILTVTIPNLIDYPNHLAQMYIL